MGLAVFIVSVGVYQLITYRQRRLDTIILNDGSHRERSFSPTKQTNQLFNRLAGSMTGFSSVFLNESRREKLEKKLEQAGMNQTPEDMIATQIAGGVIGVAFGCLGFLAGAIGFITV